MLSKCHNSDNNNNMMFTQYNIKYIMNEKQIQTMLLPCAEYCFMMKFYTVALNDTEIFYNVERTLLVSSC